MGAAGSSTGGSVVSASAVGLTSVVTGGVGSSETLSVADCSAGAFE